MRGDAQHVAYRRVLRAVDGHPALQQMALDGLGLLGVRIGDADEIGMRWQRRQALVVQAWLR
jgi:hypothetical protein